ncbi:MAG: helix-turn-helix domain-containing protein [Bacteroidales bacterium]
MEFIITSEDRLKEIIKECLADLNPGPIIQAQSEPKHVYSIRELAFELQCSTTKVQQLKNSGKIPYTQFGRKCIFSVNDVLKALSQDTNISGSLNKKKKH